MLEMGLMGFYGKMAGGTIILELSNSIYYLQTSSPANMFWVTRFRYFIISRISILMQDNYVTDNRYRGREKKNASWAISYSPISRTRKSADF